MHLVTRVLALWSIVKYNSLFEKHRHRDKRWYLCDTGCDAVTKKRSLISSWNNPAEGMIQRWWVCDDDVTRIETKRTVESWSIVHYRMKRIHWQGTPSSIRLCLRCREITCMSLLGWRDGNLLWVWLVALFCLRWIAASIQGMMQMFVMGLCNDWEAMYSRSRGRGDRILGGDRLRRTQSLFHWWRRC